MSKNELNLMTSSNEKTISSLEVAEMVDKTHANLLRDIKRYQKQMIQPNEKGEIKIDVSDFFKESTYKTEQGKELLCYDITKKGCEFIAHKLTGVKGTVFTARYINKFHDMEQELQQPKQPELTEKERFLLKNSKTWFQRNNWKMKMICDGFGWERKYLYHKILSELSDIYNLGAIERMYENINGHKPKYKMDLMDYFYPLQVTADKYIDYLLGEAE